MLKIRIAYLLVLMSLAAAQTRTNDPAAVELFRDRGFGLFIHWSVDGSLGGVISHSLVGAAPDYVERFLPRPARALRPRMVRVERAEERVVREDASGKVTERIIHHYDPTGNSI